MYSSAVIEDQQKREKFKLIFYISGRFLGLFLRQADP